MDLSPLGEEETAYFLLGERKKRRKKNDDGGPKKDKGQKKKANHSENTPISMSCAGGSPRHSPEREEKGEREFQPAIE